MTSLRQDISFALRSLRLNPAFACVAALTLAVAIGANTAVFTVMNGVLLRPLPFANADRLMVVSYWPTYNKHWLGAPALLGRDFLTFQRANRSFDRVAWVFPHGALLTGTGEAATLPGAQVTADFFSVLGVKPALGRTFTHDEAASTGGGVVVISHNLWRDRFASDSTVLGRTIVLDGQPETIIGVMPDNFDFPHLPAEVPVRGVTPFPASEYWQPISLRGAYGNYPGPVIGRLRPGVTLQRAQTELQSIAKSSFVLLMQRQRWSWVPRGSEASIKAQVLPLRDIYLAPPTMSPEENVDARRPLLFFSAAVALVLVIGCSNVAGLLLMRTMSRTHEIAIRAALGASRRRLVQLSLVESMCISITGAIVGMPLAWAGVRVLLHLAPSGAIPLTDQVRIDGRVLALSIAMVLVTGMVAGLAPSIFAARHSPQSTLGRGNRMSQSHPVLETTTALSIAFALMLLTGAGLLVESFARLQAIRLGFEPGAVVVMRVEATDDIDSTIETMRAFRERVVAELARLPRTVSVAAGSRYLVGRSPGYVGPVSIEGRANAESDVVWSVVTPDYFNVLRMPIIAGRAFTKDDDQRSPPVAVVAQSFAKRAWPGESAIGKRIWMEFLAFPPKNSPVPSDASEWVTVVGLVDDAIQESIKKAPPGVIYSSMNQTKSLIFPGPALEFYVRTAGDPATVMPEMRRAMYKVAPDVSIAVLSPLTSLVATERAQPLFQAQLIAAFSILALLLAAVGTYSTLAYSVAQRRRELAIRLALGAQPASVIRLVARRGALLAAVGVCAGLVGSLAFTRALQSLLYDTSATDPRSFAAAALLLILAAVLACVFPARRATRIDPIVELRRV